jgi:hypothetical protein
MRLSFEGLEEQSYSISFISFACPRRNNEELIASVVTDMQNPVTPIIEAALAGDGFHDARRMIPRHSEIVHYGAAIVDENFLRIGAMEIDLGHVRPLSVGRLLTSRCIFSSWDPQPVRTTHLPSLQDNMSCAGGTLLGFSQWEGN